MPWTRVIDGFYVANTPPSVVLPATFSAGGTLAIEAQYQLAKSTWFTAGWMSALLNLPNVGIVRDRSYRVPLRKKQLYELNVDFDYQLEFEVSWWIPELLISVWESVNKAQEIFNDSTLVPGTSYIAASSNPLNLLLPLSAAIGAKISVLEDGQGSFTINLNPGQVIRFGNITTTIGTGYIRSTQPGDRIELELIAPDFWLVVDSLGNFEVI